MELEQFVASEEQLALRDTVRRLVESRSPEAEVRRVMATDTGYDEATWQAIAELGLLGLAVPQEYGGAGAGWREVAVVVEELGRGLVPSPYFASAVLATAALRAAGGPVAEELLPRLAAGTTIATVAVAEDAGRWDLASVGATAQREGDGWLVEGHKALVPHGQVADVLLVAARAEDGVVLLAVASDADGLTVTAQPPLDPTSRFARLELTRVPARLVSASAGVLEQALRVGVVLLGAEQAGGARRTLAMASDYARTRTQFGRAIGSFQAVKHKCADMLLRTESAGALAAYGAWVADTRPEDLVTAAPTVAAFCAEAFMFCAATNIQVHGGIGFTWEHPAHLYYKRAKSSELLLGGPTQHLDRLADALAV